MNIINNVGKLLNKSVNPLTTAEIAAKAPAVFARDYSMMRTDKYSMFNTNDIIDALEKEGFVVTNAMQDAPNHSARWLAEHEGRMEHAKEHGRHMVRFTHVDSLGGAKVGEDRPELVLVNSHNGACSYQLMAGIFRLVCSNGLVIRAEDFGTVNIRHAGHSIDEVIAASLNIAGNFNRINGVMDEMKSIVLKPGEVTMFALNAAKIKYGNDKKFENVKQLVEPIRQEDGENNLWNVFNRAQEHLIRGGFKVTQKTAGPVKSINEDVRINSELWNLANNYRLKRIGVVA